MVEAAMTELAERLRSRHEPMAREIVERYRDEIVDYAASSDDFIELEVLEATRTHLSGVLDNISAASISPSDEQLAELRGVLARRPHQGIPLPSIQHAFRL